MAPVLPEPLTFRHAVTGVAAAVVVVMLYGLYQAVFTVGEYDKLGLPLAGEPAGKTNFTIKTRLRYYYDCAALYTEAYHLVSGSEYEILLAIFQVLTLYN